MLQSPPDLAAPPVIQTAGLTKRYGTTLALDRLDLTIQAGEVYGLGPNGAGETTTIRLLLGLHCPTAGRAALFGLDAFHEPATAQRRVADVAGEPGLWPSLTDDEALELLAGLHPGTDTAYRDELVDRVFAPPAPAVLALSAATGAGPITAALWIVRRRGLGLGLWETHDSRDTHPWGLRLPEAFAVRSEFTALAWWVVGIGGFALLIGVVSQSVSGVALSPTLTYELARVGAEGVVPPAGYLGFVFLIFSAGARARCSVPPATKSSACSPRPTASASRCCFSAPDRPRPTPSASAP
ncbi:MAG TPA: ATP-binding cassette domain-containing protein [Solirubrobacteraceae bacterium]